MGTGKEHRSPTAEALELCEEKESQLLQLAVNVEHPLTTALGAPLPTSRRQDGNSNPSSELGLYSVASPVLSKATPS